MFPVGYDFTVFEIYTIFMHPFFCLLILPMVTPLIPLLNNTCTFCRIAKCTKRMTFLQGMIEFFRDSTVGYAVSKLLHQMKCLP